MKITELELVKADPNLQTVAHGMVPSRADLIDMVARLVGLKTILVPIDFSAVSEKAIAYAVAFARQFDAQITLLHVVDLFQETAAGSDQLRESALNAVTVRARGRLEMIALAEVPPDICAQIEVRVGTPWRVINAAARELRADLIILTTLGLTGIRRVLLGSTAERIGCHAPCPVLIVRQREHGFVSTAADEGRGDRSVVHDESDNRLPPRPHAMTTTFNPSSTQPEKTAALDLPPPDAAGQILDLVPQILHLKQILVPIDFSVTAEKALAYAMPFAEHFGAKLTVAHVADLTIRPVEYGSSDLYARKYTMAAQQKLEEVLRDRLPKTLPQPVATAARAGIPWLEICKLATEIEADLIVLTTHGYTGLKRVFLGSTAERVVRHAPCPVLVVREKEHELPEEIGASDAKQMATGA